MKMEEGGGPEIEHATFLFRQRLLLAQIFKEIRKLVESRIAGMFHRHSYESWNGKTCGGVVRISRNRARACPAGIRICLSARVKAWEASTVKMSGESSSWTDLR